MMDYPCRSSRPNLTPSLNLRRRGWVVVEAEVAALAVVVVAAVEVSWTRSYGWTLS